MLYDDRTAATYRAAGFGAPVPRGARPALLVVDLTRGFTEPAFPTGADLSATVEATNALIGAARSRSLPVLFTAIAYTRGRGAGHERRVARQGPRPARAGRGQPRRRARSPARARARGPRRPQEGRVGLSRDERRRGARRHGRRHGARVRRDHERVRARERRRRRPERLPRARPAPGRRRSRRRTRTTRTSTTSTRSTATSWTSTTRSPTSRPAGGSRRVPDPVLTGARLADLAATGAASRWVRGRRRDAARPRLRRRAAALRRRPRHHHPGDRLGLRGPRAARPRPPDRARRPRPRALRPRRELPDRRLRGRRRGPLAGARAAGRRSCSGTRWAPGSPRPSPPAAPSRCSAASSSTRR